MESKTYTVSQTGQYKISFGDNQPVADEPVQDTTSYEKSYKVRNNYKEREKARQIQIDKRRAKKKFSKNWRRK